jgi:ParB-like chromosome segregation protein Spo0J
MSTKSKRPASSAPLKFAPAGLAESAPNQPLASSDAQQTVTLVPTNSLRDSAYLSPGRLPGLEAIRGLRDQIGGIAALCSDEATDVLVQLSPRERDLALLAASIALHGVQEPLIARATPGGRELVAGHRRLRAAELAGVPELPVWIIEGMSDEEAAARVARSNHNRAPLNAWQFACLAGAIRAAKAEWAANVPASGKPRRAGAPQRADSAAAVARAMGIGYSTAKDYLKIQSELTDDVLVLVTPRLADAHAALGALPFRRLRALAQIESLEERVRQIRLATMFEKVEKPEKRQRTFEVREGRGGAYILRVMPVERLPLEDARRLLKFLSQEEQRVRARVELLSSVLDEGIE